MAFKVLVLILVENGTEHIFINLNYDEKRFWIFLKNPAGLRAYSLVLYLGTTPGLGNHMQCPKSNRGHLCALQWEIFLKGCVYPMVLKVESGDYMEYKRTREPKSATWKAKVFTCNLSNPIQ